VSGFSPCIDGAETGQSSVVAADAAKELITRANPNGDNTVLCSSNRELNHSLRSDSTVLNRFLDDDRGVTATGRIVSS
jgi:hypothetical protein